MAQEFHIQTSQNVELGYVSASLGDRILAYFLDVIIGGAYVTTVYLIFSAFGGILGGLSESLIFYLVWLLPYFFYHLLFEVFNNGQSPGKRTFGLRVVNVDGSNVTFASYFLRWLLRLVDINLTSGLGAIISIAVSDTGQRIGDRAAGTTVVKQQKEYRLEQLAYSEADPEYIPTYPEVVALTSKHVELIRETLDNSQIDNIRPHLERLASKIAAKMQIELDRPPREFLVRVVKDYSHLKSL